MRKSIATSSLVVLMCGCNALDEPAPESGTRLIIPVDERPVQQALTAPPPISGGTLAASPDGAFVVAADPDRDRISILELATEVVRHVALERGDEPGRVVIDDRGRAHVALRRGGAVVSVDLQSAELGERRRVCAAPRGLAHDAERGLLHVACADGKLVTLTAEGRTLRALDLETDLRDVMVRGEALLVTSYKSAELLVLDASGNVEQRVQPPKTDVFLTPRDAIAQEPPLRVMQPHLAWRAVQSSDGSVTMLHQSAAEDMIDIDQEPTPDSMSSYGGGGGGFSCEGIVQTNVTQIDGAGGVRELTLGGVVLGVDVSRSPADYSLVVATPGAAEPDAPRPTVVSTDGASGAIGSRAFGQVGGVVWVDPGLVGAGRPAAGVEIMGCSFMQPIATPGQPTAVTHLPNGDLVVQSREPAILTVMATPPWGEQRNFDLGGDSVRDTGHDVFHRDAGAGIACASCHGEGGDDGHTWLFSGLGARRTQAVNVGLEGTAPFHWDGDMTDLGTLMAEVFVGRMGGVHQSRERLDAVASWLFAQRPFAPMVDSHDPAAERGRALFESAEVGCAGCHAGELLTDNRSYDVGTGDTLQVPSLRGVAYRAPFIHDGCAETLRDRFDPGCGGEKHGQVAHLDDAQVDDLIAYLRSL